MEESAEEIPVLLKREDGFLWLDVPVWTSEIDGLLAAELSLHPVAREYCRVRNHMPMVHGYRDHVFMVLHRPVVLGRGETRLVELDLFVGDRFLVTVHKRDEASVAAVEGVSEIEETVARIGAGRIAPRTPVELTHALVSLMALRQRLLVQDVAVRVAEVEQKVLHRQLTNPEHALEEMFLVRYELLSVRTTAAHSEEVLARARKLLGPGHHDDEAQLADLQDMFRRVHRMTDSEQELLAGVIDLYRTRNDTKMMIAMRAARGARRRDAAHHRHLVGLRHERHRQCADRTDPADHRVDHHGRHQWRPAALDQEAGLVVTEPVSPSNPVPFGWSRG